MICIDFISIFLYIAIDFLILYYLYKQISKFICHLGKSKYLLFLFFSAQNYAVTFAFLTQNLYFLKLSTLAPTFI